LKGPGRPEHRLAWFVHDNSGAERGPFVTWSCQRDEINDISSSLELLLTFEGARGGAVFFDSIDRMSRQLQSELLRFLTDETLHRGDGHSGRSVRLITGTHTALLSHVNDGTFDDAVRSTSHRAHRR
jgi:DNA-binding NtrC family response regulator